jgi:hypothetical protein
MAKAIIEHEFETENETARRELKVHDKRCLQSPEWEQVYEHGVPVRCCGRSIARANC